MSKAPILLVEDDPSLVEALSFILEEVGFEVESTSQGDEALRRMRRQPFAAVVLDIMLPGIDGFDVLRTIRAERALAATPVIVLTAKGQADDRRTAEVIGANAFITKPFSNAEVVDCVSRLVGELRPMEDWEERSARTRDAAIVLPILVAVLLAAAGRPDLRETGRALGRAADRDLRLRGLGRGDPRELPAGAPTEGGARAACARRRDLMLHVNVVIATCLGYVAILFAVAFAGDRRARRDPGGWLASPLVYTLSISIYCTSWTFFGAVGSAARSGLEFATIYLGPTIVFVGWWVFLRKLVTVGRVHHITSIADFISARFGKSPALGALVTIVALVATAPYIALQLKALTASFQVITFPEGAVAAASIRLEPDYAITVWVAAGLCLFSIMFGVRNIDVNERHHGVIAAIALEAVVKLAALLAIGVWVVGQAATPAAVFAGAPASLTDPAATFGARWITLLILAGAAVICLPRQFQVTVVENIEREPDPHRLVALPALSPAHHPLRRADRARRAAPLARRLRPRPLRADAPAQRPAGLAGALRFPRRLLVGHLDGDRVLDRALDDDLEPRRHAAGAALRADPDDRRARRAELHPRHAAGEHRLHRRARLPLLLAQRHLRCARRDRAHLLLRGGAVPAGPRRRALLAARHPPRRLRRAGRRVRDLGLRPLPAELRRLS